MGNCVAAPAIETVGRYQALNVPVWTNQSRDMCEVTLMKVDAVTPVIVGTVQLDPL
jgi:hypothetical protein